MSDIEREEFPSYVELWTVDPRMQLRYMGDSADLSIYYWYGADEAPRALEAAYNLVALIEAETDLISIDGQTGERCASPNLPMAVGIYTGTRSTVLRAIAEREDGPSPTAMKQRQPRGRHPRGWRIHGLGRPHRRPDERTGGRWRLGGRHLLGAVPGFTAAFP